MRTPDGKECRHYYQDFHRGRNVQECRLAKDNLNAPHWHPNDCAKCPVPAILQANADPDMVLKWDAKTGFLGFGRRIVITATSQSDGSIIPDPYVGRTSDNKGLEIFRQALEDNDND